tara:strand:+ start:2914 stop:3666 length:753 start_codon:yes stop_codon:yes gene_type:complete
MAKENKFPSEIIDLPSGGKIYSPDSPLASGKLEIKYMTAKEEDILTSQNLLAKGVVIETVLDSLIVTDGVKSNDMILGDKNAVMVAARILAYGPDYQCEVMDPTTNERVTHVFNLADCPFKELDEELTVNEFTIKLPISKSEVTFKLLTGKEEKSIDREIDRMKKLNMVVTPQLTTRLKRAITAVNGDTEQGKINSFVDNMLARDSLYLRTEMTRVSPDIELKQEIEIGGELVTVEIPMTTEFFWPKAGI